MDDVAVSAALDRLSELERAATPGPWLRFDDNDYFSEFDLIASDGTPPPRPYRHGDPDADEICDEWEAWQDAHAVGTVAELGNHLSVSVSDEQNSANAALVAEARNALPALLAVARAAEACESEWTALGALDGPDDLDDDFDALRVALAALDAP